MFSEHTLSFHKEFQTSHYVLNHGYSPHYSKYKGTTHHTITQPWQYKNIAYKCQMKVFSKFQLPTVFQSSDIDLPHSDYNIFFYMLHMLQITQA